jgi:hypothetical protein
VLLYLGINIINQPFISNLINDKNETELNNNNSIIETPSPIVDNSLTLPQNDYIINNINWSSYPNLQIGYIHLAQVCEPNEIVPHKYMAIGVMSEVKNGNNRTLVYEQLGSVALEIRHMCGPNSAICVFGTDHGIVSWTVTMRVYDDKVYY